MFDRRIYLFLGSCLVIASYSLSDSFASLASRIFLIFGSLLMLLSLVTFSRVTNVGALRGKKTEEKPVDKKISIKKPKKWHFPRFDFLRKFKNIKSKKSEKARIKEKPIKTEKIVQKPKSSFFTKLKNIFSRHKKIGRKYEIEKKGFETNLDAVVRLIEKYNRLSFSDVARTFGIGKDLVEEWGKILEEHGLIEVYYPPIGEPELRKRGVKIEEKHINKRVLFYVGAGALFILLLVVGLNMLFVREPTVKETIMLQELPTSVATAFSGKGSYMCGAIKDSVNLVYEIKDDLLRVEVKINETITTTIVKEGGMFTYVADQDSWVRRDLAEDTIYPGSGKLPSIEMECFSAKIDEDRFKIPASKTKRALG